MQVSLKLRPESADNSHIPSQMGDPGKDRRPPRPASAGRRFALPAGHMAELVRAQGTTQGAQGTMHPGGAVSTAQETNQRLVRDAPYVCRVCSSELVQPLEWSDAGEQRWQVDLHCPDCGWNGHGVFDGTQLAELEERLDLGFAELVRDLKRLRSANMTEEIERLATALEADLILPEDF